MASTDSTSGERNTLWFEVEVPKFQPLAKQVITTDVCVVGAGFAGISTAYTLALEGKKVVLLEAREAISGESGRTTAHLMGTLDDRFYMLKKYHGTQGARLATESHMEAISIMEQNIQREGGNCDFARLSAYLFAPIHKKHGAEELDEEIEAAHEAGFVGATFVDRAPVAVDIGKAICFPNQGRIHPIKYLNMLLKGIQARGGQIYTHSKMASFEGGSSAHVKTADEGIVYCNNIVLCTNNSVDSMELMLKEEAFRSYAIAGVVPKGSVQDALFWDTEDPYHYVRLSPRDASTEWLISGGEDHRVGASVDYSQPFTKLEQWTRERFPALGEIFYRWSGEVWEPADLLGYLGRYTKDKENVFVITGDSGTGLTHTTIGAKIVTDLIMNRPNPYTALYAPTRKPSLRAVPGGMKAAFEMSSGYLNWIKRGDIADIEDLKPNTGGVLIKNRKPIACYKDETGKVTTCSAVCTHLYGIVNWNDSEKSWDCPCHGSRFDKYGKCIQGPAIKDLPPAQ
eukprot:Phypoly_transcript_07261.p1 GENE.Phypoly_transcript_07261~~Phypoly_transcript_07261.p1  ORF type:complete len:512 (+),score=54.22 Phypoly_transcript_07261:70-1605(+)